MKKSIPTSKNSSKSICFLDGERVNVGIDVHKKSFSVTVWSEMRRRVVSRWTQPSDSASLLKALARYRDRIDGVVYEAGPTGYSLVRALREDGFDADVIAPSRTPRSTGQEAKSDRLDSRKLAMWSAKGLLRPVGVPSLEEEADRQVFRIREDMVKKRRRIKQQIKSFLLQHGIAEPEGLATWAKRGLRALRTMVLSAQLRYALDILLADLDHQEAQVRKADAALRALAGLPRHREAVAALETVPGVGIVTAMAFRLELIHPERFGRASQVAAIVGLAPLVVRTGQSVREGPLMKCGNARLRTMLIEAAWRWVANEPWAAEKYAHLTRNTGNKKKAIAGVARRLAITLWRMSLRGASYRPPLCVEPPVRKSSGKRKPRERARAQTPA